MEPTYWLDLFTGTTWKEFLDHGGQVSGFRESRWNTVKRIRPGESVGNMKALRPRSPLLGPVPMTSAPSPARWSRWSRRHRQKRPLDILVNNAAGQILAPTHKMSSRAIDAVLGIVLHGSAYCTVAAGRRWIDAGERNKVVMSILTVSALMSAPFTVPSAMAKAGVLTKSLAVEWGPRGIRTCAIVPGLFPTEGAWSRLMPKERGGDEELVKTIPLRRVGEHIELANLAAFLVSDGAAYITGDAVVIDGGKMQSGGGGASTQSMLEWTDEQWEAIRPKKK